MKGGRNRKQLKAAKMAQISKLHQMFLASPNLMNMNSCTDRQEQMYFEKPHFCWLILVAK